MPALFAYAADQFGDDFLAEAWEDFFLWDSVPDDLTDSRELGTTFDPFFVFSFVPDSAADELPDGWPSEPLAQHFLHQKARVLRRVPPRVHRAGVQESPELLRSRIDEPGRAIDLKDILTGGRVHVLEQSASRTLRAGDLTFTRVVKAGGASIMIGASPWVIPPAWHLPVIEFREQLRPAPASDTSTICSNMTSRFAVSITRSSTRS